ncbi:MAG: hypothetical protein ACRC8P_01990 [Spiroplasma sp.]
MLVGLSILVSVSLTGILFCLLQLLKINKIKKNNLAEPIKNKKWRKGLNYTLIICSIFLILAVSLFFSLYH